MTNKLLPSQKEQYFDMLLKSVEKCDLCTRLCGRKKVLSRYNGNLYSKILFLAEAPGRLGAECTGIPLYGDRSGENFEVLLGNIGWHREQVFISNAILCNPQDEKGNNATPTQGEILNCSYYLKMLISLISPEVIITLGAKALNALQHIAKHSFSLKEDVGQCLHWGDIKLIPLYHTGPRAMIHRSFSKQKADFIKISHIVNPLIGLKQKQLPRPSQNKDSILSEVVKMIILMIPELSFFKLTKLLYLMDYHYYKLHKHTITKSVYLRMQDGPWLPTLKTLISQLNGTYLHMEFVGKKQYIISTVTHIEQQMIDLDEEVKCFIIEKIKKYGAENDSELKRRAYLTEPMRYILREEKNGQHISTKTPILYNDKAIGEE